MSKHETITELLVAWDAGDSVWTLEMSGFGPGYEQALQVAAIEMARDAKDMPRTDDEKADRERFDAICTASLRKHDEGLGGLSGAQYGAARWLAWRWCFGGGPAALIAEAKEKDPDDDRAILVSRHFPKAPEVVPT